MIFHLNYRYVVKITDPQKQRGYFQGIRLTRDTGNTEPEEFLKPALLEAQRISTDDFDQPPILTDK